MDTLFFTDEHNMLIDLISDFAKSEIIPIAREIDQTSRFPSEVINKLGDLGLLSIPVPKEYGGSGMDNVAYAAAIMELAKADASVAITVAAHTSLGTMPIVLAGTEEQKKKYVPKLASGEMLGAFGLTEPNAGSDAGATKTTAVRNGNNYTVNGGKIFITNAGVAGLLSFTAQIIEEGKNIGIGAFVIPTDIDGLTISEPEKKMGWKASDTRQLFFNNMLIDESNMIAAPGEGFKIFLKILTGGRISIAALAVGTAQGAYERALKYSTERKAFGKEINKFQSIGFKLSDMATQIEAAKLLTFHAAWKKDNGQDIIKEAAMAKLFASEAAMKITTDAIQIHGGYGYVKDYDVERYFRDAKILEIGEGTSEVQRLIILKQILKKVESLV
ncbi:MAG: acyl-CoA dehydrogenase family protein [Candidatus Marinimicrobia bacterium]|jgi:alkylation response protein AidB-like acyl-CoA dehydrogenase|nr:acyl-CoA dehydrogenase family protein [Candidatus Neomarinimicrobiota bacterium]